jgi:hypothetical protein
MLIASEAEVHAVMRTDEISAIAWDSTEGAIDGQADGGGAEGVPKEQL